MASPVGHAMVGIASAAVVARALGVPGAPALWIGAFVASGLPDLDLVCHFLGKVGPRFHRNASHSLIALGTLLAAAWTAGRLLGIPLDGTLFLPWSAALLSHPLLDWVTTGPSLAKRGYGIALFWPLGSRRWFLSRPLLDQSADWVAFRSGRDAWNALHPEIVRLGPPSAAAIALALLI